VNLYLSKALFRKKDYASCKELLTKVLEQDDKEPRAFFNLAYCLYQSAVETFNLNERKVA